MMLQRRDFLIGGMLAFLVRPAFGDTITLSVVSSGGFAAALKALAPRFTEKTGVKLDLGYGPSMGTTVDAVPMRLQRGEPIDVVIMVGYSLDALAKDGKVLDDSKIVLARSSIGVIVKTGAPHPDISTPDAVKVAMLNARSIAYSDSASGVYIEKEMIPHLGIAAELAGKAHMIPAEPVGQVVARGDADLGFQQISELKPIKGIDLIGPLPEPLQKITLFSAGIVAASKNVEASRQLLAYLSSSEAKQAIADSGLEPAAQ